MKNKKLKKGECCGQHSADVAVLASQDKKCVSMISTYRKYETHVAINKQNHEETKPVVICDCNVTVLGVDLKDKMLHPILAGAKERYQVVFEIIQEANTQCNDHVLVTPKQQKYRFTKIQAFTSTRPHGKTHFLCSLSCTQASIS
jgi:hypothetical protein